MARILFPVVLLFLFNSTSYGQWGAILGHQWKNTFGSQRSYGPYPIPKTRPPLPYRGVAVQVRPSYSVWITAAHVNPSNKYSVAIDKKKDLALYAGPRVRKASKIARRMPSVGESVWSNAIGWTKVDAYLKLNLKHRKTPYAGVVQGIIIKGKTYPGYSGSVLWNQNGEIIGICRGGLKDGRGAFIAANELRNFINKNLVQYRPPPKGAY